MPHTSKKARKSSVPRQNNNRLTVIIVAAIIAIIAGAGGYYFYSSAQHSISTPTSTTTSSSSALVYAKFNTTQGMFEAELFQNATPKTVANFVSLANSGFYNNLVWHRIVKGFVIQTGDPNTRGAVGNPCSWGQGSSTSSIPFEYVPSLHNDLGYLGMASTAAGAPGTSQFYINLTNNTSLDGNYAVFGKVISGMNVVDAIGNLPVSSSCQTSGGSPPLNPSQAMLISVTIQSTP
jgi:peptidyl-prolyl cis-trans isomerase B (cyclophilin B)